MSFCTPPSLGSRFHATLRSFAQGVGLPFAPVLTEDSIAAAAPDGRFGSSARTVYTLPVTLWAFLGQVLAERKACVEAVARVIVLRAALGLPACSSETGAYCKARGRLPDALLPTLTRQVGQALEDEAPAHWRWHNRRVLLVDGTTLSLPDTPENQEEYAASHRRVGFPMIRLVVLLAFATAVVIDAAIGPNRGKGTGETSLFRSLFDNLRPDDVVVADRLYCSYFTLAAVQQRGAAAACRLRGRSQRKTQVGPAGAVPPPGPADEVQTWPRPQQPDWMDDDTYAAMPATLTVRIVRFVVENPGYRSRHIAVATTLLDAIAYPAADIADLYHRRWHIELDLRSIKRTLDLEHLTCLSPAMIRKEVWAHLLAYNLVRKVAAQAAWSRGLCPRQISFAGVVQTLQAFRDLLLTAGPDQWLGVCQTLFVSVARHQVGDRPGRVEPRCLKRRRQNEYPRLEGTRAEARARLFDPTPAAAGA